MVKKFTCAIGLVQLTSGDSLEDNVAVAGDYVEKVAKDGSQIIFLPENTFYMRREAHHKDEVDTAIPSAKYSMADYPGILAAQGWAKEYGVWLVIGSIAAYEGRKLPYNRSVVVNPEGFIAAHYDKIHLFDVELASGEGYAESARITAGERAVALETPWGGLGLSICYDLRFPYLYRDLAQAGASIFSIPAAFTVPTGKAHWHILQRARAIENGCFVAAAAQCGEHPGGRLSYGHSLLVNPWGEVLLDLGDAPGYGVVEVDLAEVSKARTTIPSLQSGCNYLDATNK